MAMYVYRCEGDERFTLHVLEDSVRVRWDLLTVTLSRVPAASGARYAAEEVEFWSGVSEARLWTASRTLEGCRGQRAASPWDVSRMLGYDLRAIGQEPGWMVEVDSDRRMHVLADYGEVEFFTPAPEALAGSHGETVYRARTGTRVVTLEVRGESCQDVMSGESFPLAMTLNLDGVEYRGCGRSLHE